MKVDVSDMREGLERLRNKAPGSIWRAVDRAAKSGRAFMRQKIAADTGIAPKNVERDIAIEKVGQEQANLVVQGRRIPLVAFSAKGPEPSRGRGRGVSYRLPGSAGRVSNAFIATMESKHRGVFKRAANAKGRGPKPNRSQLPIIELYGPSLPHVFEKYLPDGAAHAEEALRKNLEHEISYLLTK